MMNIAVLLTCFNRKKKTLAALHHLYKAKEKFPELNLKIYLTDDGSVDGTSQAVNSEFPDATILKGTGSLYWAGGMKNSWQAALNKGYHYFLLLNDDTNVNENLFQDFLLTHEHCLKQYEIGGIYIGSTQDSKNQSLSYGGAKLVNKFTFKYEFLEPNGTIQSCELGNANIMFVSQNVVSNIGILSDGYKHGVADYDYTLKAHKKKQPVLLMPNFLGTCTDDHIDIYQSFRKKSFSGRLKLLKSPLGLDLSSNLNLMKRHFPLRVPFVLGAAMLKLFFPSIYINISKNR